MRRYPDGTELDGSRPTFSRERLAGSMISGVTETPEIIDYCAARNVPADIELI
uniref:hypothetical protein n=1 Tax=Burkholderia anthina TaxID=179879 RepID=UPI001589ABA3|nr:hypothetical protein [Burkholderia anthina]